MASNLNAIQRTTNRSIEGLKRESSSHQDLISQHRGYIDEHKKSILVSNDGLSRLGSRIDKQRETLLEQLTNIRDELSNKIELNDTFYIGQFEGMKENTNKDRNVFQNAMTELRDELSGEMHKETDTLKTYVVTITQKSSAHRETLQDKYDEKIDKIKDVCASYFSKYEKHLLSQQELMQNLEGRQQDWVTTIIKPQEVNSARLYALESRLNEGDKIRNEDNQFHKDTLKKLLFALEQHLSALSGSSPLTKVETANVGSS